LAIGAAAQDDAESERQRKQIKAAVGEAEHYMTVMTEPERFDVDNVNWALQSIARVAPALDQAEDLQGKAVAVLARNPETLNEGTRATVVALSKDAAIALQAAGTRVHMDAPDPVNADPVNNPAVVQAAQAIVAVANAIINAPTT
jgi:hypothetical protein